MDPFVFHRQFVDRTARTPAKLALAPERAVRMGAEEPGETPYDVVLEEAIVRLRRYDPASDERAATPVLIVYPFINDPSILDFRPDRSVVRGLLERGFPVYVLEWLSASPVDRSIGLEDVVARYLSRCVSTALEDAESDATHLLGYSVGAPIAAAYAALRPDSVRTLVLQGPPLDFEAGEGVGQLRTIAAHLDHERVAETLETVPAPLLEAPFVLRKPVEYSVTNPLQLWDRFDDDEFVEDYARRLAWTVGGPDVPAALFRDFVEDLLLENRLIRSDLVVDGERVDLGNVEMPVLIAHGRDDKFVPREASLPFLEAAGSDDVEALAFPTTHVGLSIAPEAHEEWWPRAYDWLEERS